MQQNQKQNIYLMKIGNGLVTKNFGSIYVYVIFLFIKKKGLQKLKAYFIDSLQRHCI